MAVIRRTTPCVAFFMILTGMSPAPQGGELELRAIDEADRVLDEGGRVLVPEDGQVRQRLRIPARVRGSQVRFEAVVLSSGKEVARSFVYVR